MSRGLIEKSGDEILATLRKMTDLQRGEEKTGRLRSSAARPGSVGLRLCLRSSGDDGATFEEHDFSFSRALESYIRQDDGVYVLTWAAPWARLRHLEPGEDDDLRVPAGEREVELNSKFHFDFKTNPTPALGRFRGATRDGAFAPTIYSPQGKQVPAASPGSKQVGDGKEVATRAGSKRVADAERVAPPAGPTVVPGEAVPPASDTSTSAESSDVVRPDVGSSGLRALVFETDREQDEATRFAPRGTIVIDGAPGTGKTTVAIQRAAWLLAEETAEAHRLGNYFSQETTVVFVRNNNLMRSIEGELAEMGVKSEVKEFLPWRDTLLRQRGVLSTRHEPHFRRRKKGDPESSQEVFLKNAVEVAEVIPAATAKFWARYWSEFESMCRAKIDTVRSNRHEFWKERARADSSMPPDVVRRIDRAHGHLESALKQSLEAGRLAAERGSGAGVFEFCETWQRVAPAAPSDITLEAADTVFKSSIELVLGSVCADPFRAVPKLKSSNPRAEADREKALRLLEPGGELPAELPWVACLQEIVHSEELAMAVRQAAERVEPAKPRSRIWFLRRRGKAKKAIHSEWAGALESWRQAIGATGTSGELSENDLGLALLALAYSAAVEAHPLLPRWARPLEEYSHVVVDEAQDFSLAELRFLTSRSGRTWRAVTLAGDLRQAVRSTGGIHAWEDLGAVNRYPALAVSYRSVPSLGRFVTAFYEKNFDAECPFRVPEDANEEGTVAVHGRLCAADQMGDALFGR